MMNKQELPAFFDNDFESIYGNFGARFAALLLDGLILAPMTIGALIINGMDLYNFYYTIPVTLLVTLFYSIYLPVKFGATPGKRLMGLRILKSDGDQIGLQDAFLRYLPSFILAIIAVSCNLVAVQFADPELYNGAKWLEKSTYLTEVNPRMYYSQIVLSNLYVFANIIVFLSNPRKRSISDFSGNTVVIYEQFLKKVVAFRNPTLSE